jgi:peptide/nickel transport system substrate-binding protein
MSPRTRQGLALLGSVILIAAACASPTTTATPTTAPGATVPTATGTPPVNPGTLTVMVADLGNERFDDVFADGDGVANYMSLVHGWLLASDATGASIPGIAESSRLSDDGLTWTFKIREGVKWQDGTDLTAEDVVWTLQQNFGSQAVDYSTMSDGIRVASQIDKIGLTGPNEVSISTKVFTREIGELTVENAPSPSVNVLPKRSQLGESLAYEDNPIGAGPMKLTEHIPASSMTFERFEDYYYQPKLGFSEDRRAKFQTLKLVLVPDEATRVAALRSGEADIIQASVASRKQVEDGGGRIVFGSEGLFLRSWFSGCWIPREPMPPCNDKRVRQAFAYALDTNAIAQLYGPGGFTTKGWGVVTPSSVGYAPELDPYPFDPDKARQLLAEAGYPGGKGFPQMVVNTFAGRALPFLVEGAQVVADTWKRELGIDVVVKVVDKDAFDTAEEQRKVFGEIVWREDNARRDVFGNLNEFYGLPDAPKPVHNDPELFALVQEVDKIRDPAELGPASTELFKRLRDEDYTLSVGYANVAWGVGPRVLTWQPDPLSGYVSALHTITLAP